MDGIEHEPARPRKRRRAVGPPGAQPVADEPRPEPRAERAERADDRSDLERYLAERPPHHEPR